MATLHFPHANRRVLAPYLPPHAQVSSSLRHTTDRSSLSERPFITLTYAQSLDSQIALSHGRPTPLSGPSSKAMTHYLRSTHDAILVGSGTAIADDPSLNCRIDDVVARTSLPPASEDDPLSGQPRPVVLDRRARWDVSMASKVMALARDGRGRAPWIIVDSGEYESMPSARKDAVAATGGEFLLLTESDGNPTSFRAAMHLLAARGIRSVMIEGGATLINDILSKHSEFVDSVIITIAPVLLGEGGVVVCPRRGDPTQSAVKFRDVQYLPLDRDLVICCRPEKDGGAA